jgi:predicted HTH transcriptional regulator
MRWCTGTGHGRLLLKFSSMWTVWKSSVPGNTVKNRLQGQILSLIKDNHQITYDALAAQTEQNRKSVQRQIQALKEKGMLRRIGPPKGGHWEVIKS